MSDRIFGVIGLVIALIYAWQASIIEESFLSDVVGPKVFPYLIATVMGLASVFFVLRPDDDPVWPKFGKLLEIGMATIVLLVYAELLPVLGFVISTIFATAYLAWRLGSTPLMSLVSGVFTALGIYTVFRLILGLSLARGPLGF